MKTCNFQIVLHDDAKTWADASSLKGKTLVNAAKFKRNLRRNGLTSQKSPEWRPILKE
jgi:hypothetical protein